MYSLYLHILRNNRGAICALISDKYKSELNVVGLSTLTSYIPIPPSDVNKFAEALLTQIKAAFNNTSVSKTDVYYITVSKKRTKVFTWVDLETDVPHPYDTIGKLLLELPLLEWELLFDILEKVKDFFQENLC